MAKTDNSKEELVTIVCRSMGRPELKKALHSIHSQTYTNIEILLIKAGDIDLREHVSDFTSFPVKLIDLGKALSRPEAANVGLENAAGEFITFLDEDDWIEKNHVQTLVDSLRDNPNFKASYCNVQKTDKDGELKKDTFSTGFEPILLMRDNYIPIHAMLFERSLLTSGCRFDENFEIYEDWDFWLQLNQYTDFYHNDIITAYYRDGGESGVAVADPFERFSEHTKIGKARIALFTKWIKKWSNSDLNKMIDQLYESLLRTDDDLKKIVSQRSMSEQNLSEARKDLEEEHNNNLKHQKEIRELLTTLELVTHERNISTHKVENLEIQIRERDNEIEGMHAQLMDLRKSWSWKITAPGRFFMTLFRSILSALPRKKKSYK